MKFLNLSTVILVLAGSFIRVKAETLNPLVKGDRSFAIAITFGEDRSFEAALKRAESTGMNRRSEMQINWNEVETTPETYTYDVVNIAKRYFLMKSKYSFLLV